jgi:4-carboxymuconolactone decarboxylase
MDTAARTERGLKLLEQMLGAEQAEWTRQLWHNIALDLEQYISEFVVGEMWSRPQLDRRTRSLVTISALAALGRPLALELNIRIALNNGASRQEVMETLLHMAVYAGFPAAWEGLALAHKVFRQLDEQQAGGVV